MPLFLPTQEIQYSNQFRADHTGRQNNLVIVFFVLLDFTSSKKLVRTQFSLFF